MKRSWTTTLLLVIILWTPALAAQKPHVLFCYDYVGGGTGTLDKWRSDGANLSDKKPLIAGDQAHVTSPLGSADYRYDPTSLEMESPSFPYRVIMPDDLSTSSPGRWLLAQPNINSNVAGIYNLEDFGAKIDEKIISDGHVTASSAVITSASAGFIASDVGKHITVWGAGPQITAPGAPTLAVNGTAGTTTYYYKITAGISYGFGRYQTTASTSATITNAPNTLSATNSVKITKPTLDSNCNEWTIYRSTDNVNFYKIYGPISSNCFYDGGFTARATTPPVSNNAYGLIESTIESVESSASITIADSASVTRTSNIVILYGTDDTDALNDALDAIYDAGGGTLVIPAIKDRFCLILGQIIIPNDEAAGFTEVQVQPPLRIMGTSHGPTNVWWQFIFYDDNGTTIPMGSVLDLRYSGSTWDSTHSNAKISTFGMGKLEIDHLTLADFGLDSSPFLLTTNTTLYVHDNSVLGCDQAGGSQNDFIILGGTATATDKVFGCSGYNCAYQGYKSIIDKNWMSGIRYFLKFGYFADSITVSNNIMSETCYNPAGGAVYFEGYPGVGELPMTPDMANTFMDNTWENWGNRYIYEGNYACMNSFLNDYLGDQNTTMMPYIAYFDANSGGNYFRPAGNITIPVVSSGNDTNFVMETGTTYSSGYFDFNENVLKANRVELYPSTGSTIFGNWATDTQYDCFGFDVKRSRGSLTSPVQTNQNDTFAKWPRVYSYYNGSYREMFEANVNQVAAWDAGTNKAKSSYVLDFFDPTGEVKFKFYSSGEAIFPGTLSAEYVTKKVAASPIASASSITLTSSIAHITGTTQINTITCNGTYYFNGPTGMQITLIPDGLWTLGTSGNIGAAVTAVVGRAINLVYDGTKWYPEN
ncbi:exported hypothetical protein [uncultured Desulfobacterium sp.]|uniref:Right handed beta helix domain-containing protein n=1 Tax=uncultured Desulfobacterium sp. TaxID=201089 RepID=A0A445MWT1_9BACT|nr:exported hypothetical protein [uncultured Desulfobacterium sp.]